MSNGVLISQFFLIDSVLFLLQAICFDLFVKCFVVHKMDSK